MAESSVNINDTSYKNVQLYSQDSSNIYPNIQIENIRTESSIWKDFHGIDLLFRTFSYEIGHQGITPIAENSSLINIVAYENNTGNATDSSLVGKQILFDPDYIKVEASGMVTGSNNVKRIIYPEADKLTRLLCISPNITRSQPKYTDVSTISVGHSDYAWCIGSSDSTVNAVGSSQRPVYVDASGKITQCNQFLDVSVNHAKNSFIANAAGIAKDGSVSVAQYAMSGTINKIYENIDASYITDPTGEGNDDVSIRNNPLLTCGDSSCPVYVKEGVIKECSSYLEASVKCAGIAIDASFAAKIGKSADKSHSIGDKNIPVFITTTGDISTCTQYSDADVSHAKTADKSKFATDASYADKIGRYGQVISIGDKSHPVYIEDGSIKQCATIKQSFVSAYADLAKALYDSFDANRYSQDYFDKYGHSWEADHPDGQPPSPWNIPDIRNSSSFIKSYITYLNVGDSCTAVYFLDGRPTKCTTIKNATYSNYAQYIGNSSGHFLAGDSSNPIYLKDGSFIACIPYRDASVQYAVDSSKSKYASNLIYTNTGSAYNSIPYKQNDDLRWTRATTQSDNYKSLIVNDNNDLVWGYPNARSASTLTLSGTNQLIYQCNADTTKLVDTGASDYILQHTDNTTIPFTWINPQTIIPNESKHSKVADDTSCSKYATLIVDKGSTSDNPKTSTIGTDTTPVYVKEGSITNCISYDDATVGTAKYAKDGSVSVAQYAISGTINKIYTEIKYQGQASSSTTPILQVLKSPYTDKPDHHPVYVDNGELKYCNDYIYGARQSMVGSWVEHSLALVNYDASVIEKESSGKYTSAWDLASKVEKDGSTSVIAAFNNYMQKACKPINAGDSSTPVYFKDGRPKSCGTIAKATNLEKTSNGVLYQNASDNTNVLSFTPDASSKKQYVRISDDGKSLKWDYSFLPTQTANKEQVYYVAGVSTALANDVSTLILETKCFIKDGYFYQQSDETLKDIISEYQLSLEQLHNIRKILYKWNNGTDDTVHLGVIAQDIEKIAPEIVSTDDSGIKSVSYSLLSVLALSAVDQLYDKIQLLESKNKTLENRLDKIEAILNN